MQTKVKLRDDKQDCRSRLILIVVLYDCLNGSKFVAFHQQDLSTSSSTASGLKSMALANGWRKSTVPDRGAAGANWHLALDADSGEIIAHAVTDQDTGDASQVEPILDHIDIPIGQFTADGAYDGKPTYDAVTSHSAGAAVVIPPRSNAVERSHTDVCSQRDRHIAAINTDGRMKWQAATGYGKRSLVETAIGRYKSIIRPRLRARSFRAQQTEVAISCAILNRMLEWARPKSVRCKEATA